MFLENYINENCFGFFSECRNPDTGGKMCGYINGLLFLKEKLQDISFLDATCSILYSC